MRLTLRCIVALGGLAVAGCTPTGAPAETARLRAVHASPDAPNVDICVSGTAAFTNVAFPSATDYAVVEAGSYPVRVVVAGSGCGSAAVIEATLPLAGSTDTTVVALNTLANIEPLVLEDDPSDPVAGMVKVRFVHASPDAPTVDITLTDGTTLFDNIAFEEVGDYIAAGPGTVDLQVRDETGTTVVLTLEDVALEAGNVYTVYAVGLLNGQPALNGLITVDNQ